MNMNKKKNKFWTLCFSLIPGAGQMYMGLMKRGLGLMTLFFGICGLAVWANMGPLLLLAAVAWFYSFFDVWNIRALPEEQFAQLEDDYVFHLEDGRGLFYLLFQKYRKITALGLIIIGASALLRCLNSWIGWLLPDRLYNPFSYLFGYQMPQVIFSVIVIIIGLALIKGKKEQLDDYPVLTDGEEEKEDEYR